MTEILRNGRIVTVSRAEARKFARGLGESFPPSWTMERASSELCKRVRGTGAPACREYGMAAFRARRRAYLSSSKARRRLFSDSVVRMNRMAVLAMALAVVAVFASAAVSFDSSAADSDDVDYDSLEWTEISGDYAGGTTTENLRLVGDVTLSAHLYYNDGGTYYLDLNGYALTSELSTNGGILDIRSSSSVIVVDTSSGQTGTVTNSGSPTYGGVAYVVGDSNLTINGGTFTGNTATYGAVVYVYSSSGNANSLTINGGTFTGNTATTNGGCFYLINSTLTINGGTFSNNTAGNYGGVSQLGTESVLTINGGTFTGNTASSGAVFYFNGSSSKTLYATINGGTFSNNTASTYGGVARGTYSDLTFIGGTFTGNTASYGGVMYFTYSTISMSGGTFTGNTATTYADVLFIGNTLTLNLDSDVSDSLSSGDIVIRASSDEGFTDPYVWYDANGGSFDLAGTYGSSISVVVSSNLTESITVALTLPTDVPVLSGHEFLGWSTDGTATSAEYSAGESVSLDVLDGSTLYAVWVETVEITSVDGAYASLSSSAYVVQVGAEVTLVASDSVTWSFLSGSGIVSDYTDSGSSFSFAVSECGTVVLQAASSNDAVAVTFYAYYIAEVTYDANGGSGAPSDESYYYSEAGTYSIEISSQTPSIDSNRFVGWSDGTDTYSAGSSVSITVDADGVATLALTAVWSDTYTIYLMMNDGSGEVWQTLSVTGTSATSYTFTLPSTYPTLSGYAFLGWSDDPSDANDIVQPGSLYTLSASSVSVYLYAVWGEVTYTVSYDANGGTGAPSDQSETNASGSASFTVSSTVPTRSGYAFAGWSDGTNTYAAGDTVTLTETGESTVSITLYAVWTGVTYTIVYDSNGGSDGPDSVTYSNVQSASTTVTLSSTVPTLSGYEFEGWYCDGVVYAAGSAFDLVWTGESEVVYTLVAQWSGVVTLTYNSNGGTGGPDSESVASDDGTVSFIVSDTVPTRSGYTFYGWSLSDVEPTVDAPSVYVSGDTVETDSSVTLYAVWIAVITVSYDANGGSGAPSDSSVTVYTGSNVAYASVTLSSTVPTRSGYTFYGWTESSESGDADYAAGDTAVVSSDLTLYAVWSMVYTIVYDANGGAFSDGTTTVTVTGSSTYGFLEFTLVSDLPVLEDFGFIGWNTDADATDGVSSGTVLLLESSPSVVLYAIWGATADAAEISVSGLEGGVLTIQIDTTATITATVSGMDNTTYSLSWAVEDESVAYIVGDDDGSSVTFYGLYAGETVVTLTLTSGYDGSQQTYEFTVVVEGIQVTKIVISGSTSVAVGDSVTLKAVTYPTGATVRTVSWTVEYEDDAYVTYSVTESSTGGWITITGIYAGTVYVTATADDGSGIYASFTLTVTEVTADASVSISGYNTLVVGETNTYMAIVLPTSLTDRSATFEITNGSELVEASEVTVTEYGASISLTGVSDGSVTLTAYYIIDGDTVASASYLIAVVTYTESASVGDVAGSAVDALSEWLGDNSDAVSIVIIAVVILALLVLLDNRWLAFLVAVPLSVVLAALGILSTDLAAIMCVLAAAGVAIVASGIFTGGKGK